MAKRKRGGVEAEAGAPHGKSRRQDINPPHNAAPVTVQIITGSYESVLHGFTAAIPATCLQAASSPTGAGGSARPDTDIAFTDTFLQKDHSSSIRCLALSPPASHKVYLATGSSDERVVVYNVSTIPPARANAKAVALPTIGGRTSAPNSKNHEIGQLLQHSSTITALHFPNRTKLLSAADDNTIAITRLRDMTALTTLKAPVPKPVGRPSGDTAAPGEVPTGINDFALHPDMKAMISVSKAERCMRLWNLTTGKKGGVLTFERDTLQQIREGKWGGEGRKALWEKEEEFVVGFERGAVVFGLDSRPKARISPIPATKIHHIQYVPGVDNNILAISTEDGRILFYSTTPTTEDAEPTKAPKAVPAPPCPLLAQLGGKEADIIGRIKDFTILQCHPAPSDTTDVPLVVLTGSSDGAARVWTLTTNDLHVDALTSKDAEHVINGDANGVLQSGAIGQTVAKQVGRLIGTYETGNRITCLEAFVMTGTGGEDADGAVDDAGAGALDVPESSSSDDSE